MMTTTATVGVPPFNRSPVTTLIVAAFTATKPGDLLTYQEIDKIAGCTRDAWGNCMATVRKVLLEKFSIDLETEIGVGYRHRTDDSVHSAGQRGTGALQRSARRLRKRLELGVKDQTRLPIAKIAQLRLVEHVSSDRASKLLESSRANNEQLDVGSTLDLFRRKLTE